MSEYSREKRFAYQQQNCELTLRQGLEEYYRGHPGLLQAGQVSDASATFFHSHDLCHVFFGLDTTLDDEALADTWTIFGSDLGSRNYMRYLKENPDVKQIFKQLGIWKTTVASVRVTPRIVRVFFRARRMTRKWPWAAEDEFIDVPLGELRRNFNLQIL